MRASYDIIDGSIIGTRVFRFFAADVAVAGWIDNTILRNGSVVMPEDATLEEAIEEAIEAGILARDGDE